MDKLSSGLDLYLAGDYYAAIRILTEYIDNGGISADTAYYYIGLAYSDLQKLPEAGENLSKAVNLEPNKSMYQYRLGVVYYRLMALDKAIEHLKKSIDLNPEHQRSRFILGNAYFKQGNIEKAEHTFTKIISSSPDFADAYYYRALCSFHKGEQEKALKDLKKALEINEFYTEARIKLAQILYNQNNFSQAELNCEIVFQNGIRDYVFLRFFIDVLIKNGNIEKAKIVASEALVIYPHNLDIQNLLRIYDFENYGN